MQSPVGRVERRSGEPVDPPKAARPERRSFEGRTVRLEPLNARRHSVALHRSSHGPEAEGLWDYLSIGPFAGEPEFGDWAQGVEGLEDPLFFAILPRPSLRPSGVASYMRIVPEHRVIEIGNIWFGPQLRRTTAATEALFLLIAHAFEDLRYRRIEWKCDALNEASKRAARRLGFRYEGTFLDHMIIKGRSRDTAWFAMLEADWPDSQERFRRWLDPANFDDRDRQLTRLGASDETD